MAANELTLPADGLLLHIGPIKSGTTAIQHALAEARPTLAEHGVCYPGRQWRQMRSGLAVLGRRYRGLPEPSMEDWDELVREVHEARGQRVCISTEDMGSASAAQARRIVEDLGADRVHVVVTARRLDRLLPSDWQQRVKHRELLPYGEWLSIVLGSDVEHPEHRRFWRHHDLTRTYEKWAPSIDGRFTVIASDDSDRRVLHRTFEQMLDLPSGMLQSTSANLSLGASGVELVRRVNAIAAEQDWTDRDHRLLIYRGMVGRLQELRTVEDPSIPALPAWAIDRANELAIQREEFFAAHDVRVVGDLERLRVPRADAPRDVDAMPEVIRLEYAAAAVDGVHAGAMMRLAEEERRHRREIRALERAHRQELRRVRTMHRRRVRDLERRLREAAPSAVGPVRRVLARVRGTVPS